jgi:tetratricopeptide (TPR) repeat protein
MAFELNRGKDSHDYESKHSLAWLVGTAGLLAGACIAGRGAGLPEAEAAVAGAARELETLPAAKSLDELIAGGLKPTAVAVERELPQDIALAQKGLRGILRAGAQGKDGLAFRGIALQKLGHNELAVNDLGQWLERSGTHYDSTFHVGAAVDTSDFYNGDSDGFLGYQAIVSRGKALASLGRQEDAIADFSAAINKTRRAALSRGNTQPEFVRALIARARSLGALGRDADANADAFAAKLYPNIQYSSWKTPDSVFAAMQAEQAQRIEDIASVPKEIQRGARIVPRKESAVARELAAKLNRWSRFAQPDPNFTATRESSLYAYNSFMRSIGSGA